MNCRIAILGSCLAFVGSTTLAQEVKLTKEQRRAIEIAAKYVKNEIIGNDTVALLRAPVTMINSSQKFFIDALQKRMDVLNKNIRANSILNMARELEDIQNLIIDIEASDNNWPMSAYYEELNFYKKLYLKSDQNDSSTHIGKKPFSGAQDNRFRSTETYKDIQVGPRGGQYYINKNGKKTCVKKK